MPINISRFNIDKMTFKEVVDSININPTIILPVSAIEPSTEYGCLGISSLICWHIAQTLSEKNEILLAPIINYGYSVAFKSFPGCASISKRTYAALLRDLIDSWRFQGIMNFIIIDGNYDSSEIINDALSKQHKNSNIVVLNWHIKAVQDFIASHRNGVEYGRSQYALLSMATYIDERYIHAESIIKSKNMTVDMKIFQKWLKTGRDPEKFRSLFPDAVLSSIAFDYSAEFGKELFAYIIELFDKSICNLGL
jgi:creatinine amidohydrolase/Fe(II)-dependent formamide hydrolase-like protein